ncbi:MAG: rare lipoprotein [Vampirovibrio sp.]|jgi:rare lipoprotein A|nr:rare lipoprotein [Vampirovibrio sp.]
MVNKKLAALLATAVMLGQTGLVATLFAQAETQIPLSPVTNQNESLQVASVIQRKDINTASDAPVNGLPRPSTPDIYTIGNGEGKLKTLIQVLPQDEDTTSLFVNSTEILRFQGTVNDQTSYQRVKAMADKLNRSLVAGDESLSQIRPAMQADKAGAKEAVIRFGDEVLTSVDAQTAKTAKESEAKLAFRYTNRLRQALGATPLQNGAFPEMNTVAKASPKYKSTGRVQVGMASWYGPRFHGRRAADGSRFNMNALTAAHKTLPFGTVVKVVNQRTQKSCIVKITDRGPYAHGRVIDLSKGAAKAIGMLGSGVARVSVEIVKRS